VPHHYQVAVPTESLSLIVSVTLNSMRSRRDDVVVLVTEANGVVVVHVTKLGKSSHPDERMSTLTARNNRSSLLVSSDDLKHPHCIANFIPDRPNVSHPGSQSFITLSNIDQ